MGGVKSALLAAVGLLIAWPASGTVKCQAGETLDQCFADRVVELQAPDPPAPDRQLADALRKVLAVPTGLDADPDTGVLGNFLPALGVNGLASTAAGAGRDLGIGWQPRLLGDGADSGDSRVRAAATREPELLPVARQALRDAGRGEIADQLESTLDLVDDLELGLDYNFTNKTFGRDLGQYRPMLLDLITAFQDSVQIVSSVRLKDSLGAIDTTSGPCALPANAAGEHPKILGDQLIGALSAECQQVLLPVLEAAARSEAEYESRDTEAYESSQLQFIGNLVANNPQLTFGVAYLPRDELVGANAFAVRLSFEMGLASMGGFLWTDGDPCRDKNWAQCLRNYTAYAEANRVLMDQGNRFQVSIEYARLQAVNTDIDLPADSGSADGGLSPLPLPGTDSGTGASIEGNTLHIELPTTNRLTVRAGYGRIVMPPKDGDPLGRSARFDLVGKYQHFDADEVYRDAWSVRAIFSYEMAGLSFPIQLAYVGDSEFGVDAGRTGKWLTLVGVGYDISR